MKRRILGWLLLAAVACEDEPAEQEVVAAEVIERPLIEFAGCTELENGVCMLTASERNVDVWIDVHAAAELDVRVDDEALEFERHAADGGLRIRVAVPSESKSIEIRGVDPAWTEGWSLPLGQLQEPGAVVRAKELARAGKIAEAESLLVAVLDEAKPRDRVMVLDVLRRVLHARGDRAGALQRAVEEGELAQELGLPRAEADAFAAAAFAAQEEGENERARRFIARIHSQAERLPEARMRAAYQSSLVAANAGDMMLALRHLNDAERIAIRLGRDVAGISMMLASVLGDLGRGPDALAALHRSIDVAAGLTCGNHARQLNAAGFTHLVLAEQGLEHGPARPLLEAALALVEPPGECPSPRLYADVRVNLALDALEEAEPEEALRHISEIEDVPAYLEPWIEEINGRIGLETGRWELMPPLVRRPDPQSPVGLRWAALERHAELLERLGLIDAAIEAHVEAEGLLEEATNGIGVNVGQELFLAGRSASSRHAVRLLVHAGRHREAFCRARLARGRALRRLDRTARLGRAPAELRERWSDAVSRFMFTRDRLSREAEADWGLSESEQQRAELRRVQELDKATEALTAAFEALDGSTDALDCSDLPSPACLRRRHAGEGPFVAAHLRELARERDVSLRQKRRALREEELARPVADLRTRASLLEPHDVPRLRTHRRFQRGVARPRAQLHLLVGLELPELRLADRASGR